MPKFFKHKKTGEIISEETYKERTLEAVETNTLDMAQTGMDLNSDINENYEDYDPYRSDNEK